SVSIAGQALVIMGLLDHHGMSPRGVEIWLAIAALEAVLAIIMPNFIHRVGSAYGAAIALSFAFQYLGVRIIITGAMACAVAWIWLSEARIAARHSIVEPVGYGLTLAFIYSHSAAHFGQWLGIWGASRPDMSVAWMGEALLAATLLATVIVMLMRAG